MTEEKQKPPRNRVWTMSRIEKEKTIRRAGAALIAAELALGSLEKLCAEDRPTFRAMRHTVGEVEAQLRSIKR